MPTLITLQFRSFLRRWALVLLAAVSLAVVVLCGMREIYTSGLPDRFSLDVLGFTNRYSLILPLLLAVITFEFTGAARLTGMEEAVYAHPLMVPRHQWAMLFPPVVLTAGVFLAYVAIKLLIIQAAHLTGIFAAPIIAEAVLDILAPCVIAVLLGAAAARHLGRYSGYAVIAAFAFMIGPYTEVVPMLAQARIPAGGGGVNLYPIYDLFRVLAPDPTWAVDPLYGFPIEPKRWAVAGFWILMLGALVIPRPACGSKRGLVVRVVVSTLALCCLVFAMLPGSVLRRDFRFLGGSSIVSEQIYYEAQAPRYPDRNEPADFTVDRYVMRLVAGRQLNATVSLYIADAAHTGQYRFTLYHGYQIARVVDAEGEPVRFDQKGDYVTVYAPAGARIMTFTYRGNGGINVANSQGVYLPGDFAYYPVPGFGTVWDHRLLAPLLIAQQGAAPRFSVEFESRVPIASNLPGRTGRFDGRTASPTFVGGLLQERTVDGMRVVYYPGAGTDPERLPDLAQALHRLERRVGMQGDRSMLHPGVTVIQTPSFAPSSTRGQADTLFLGGFDPSLAPDVLVAGLPNRPDRENLKDALLRLLTDPAGIVSASGPSPSPAETARFERVRTTSRDDLQRTQGYDFPAQSVVRLLLRDRVREQGLDRTVRDTYAYLESDSPQSELQFLTEDDDVEAR